MKEYDSDYEVRLATLKALGGDADREKYDSVYEIDLEILKLTEQGGGSGSAIEEVDELPNPAENKDEFFRTKNDGKLYAPYLKSRTTTSTNRLPDEQQIDKSYLYSNGDIYHYKGLYHIIFTDTTKDYYCWIAEYYDADLEKDVVVPFITEDDAETINSLTLSSVLDGDYTDYIDIENKEIDVATAAGLSSEDITLDTIQNWESYPISAIYNAPDSAQIGNAYVSDSNYGVDFSYTGEEVEFTYDGETKVGYKWLYDEEGIITISSKKASDIYYTLDGNDKVISDVDWYIDNDGVIEPYEELPVTIYIPQLNAPDSEQAGNATIKYNMGGNIFTATYDGTLITLYDSIESKSFTGYKWISTNSNEFITSVKAEDLYLIAGSFSFMWQDGAEVAQAQERVTEVNLIKYQREETIEEWGWEELIPDEIRISTSGNITVDNNGKINGIQNLSFGDYDVDSLKTLLGEVKELKTDIALVMPVSGLDTTFTCQGMMSLLNLSAGGMDMPMLLITFPFLNMSIQKMDKLTIYYDYSIETWYIESLIDVLS